MSYAFIQDVPANKEIYQQIRSRLGDDPPNGLVVHVAIERESGLRYVDVWSSKDDWERFRRETLEPVVGEVLAGYGIPHDHSLVTIEEVDAIDTWLGGAGSPVYVGDEGGGEGLRVSG